jgi:hypothetical protein
MLATAGCLRCWPPYLSTLLPTYQTFAGIDPGPSHRCPKTHRITPRGAINKILYTASNAPRQASTQDASGAARQSVPRLRMSLSLRMMSRSWPHLPPHQYGSPTSPPPLSLTAPHHRAPGSLPGANVQPRRLSAAPLTKRLCGRGAASSHARGTYTQLLPSVLDDDVVERDDDDRVHHDDRHNLVRCQYDPHPPIGKPT